MARHHTSHGAPGDADRFHTTRWSIVLAAGRNATDSERRILNDLCGAYWYPLYAFVRRAGRQPDDAADLTQAFFAHLIESDNLAAADPARGRFRSFLLGSLNHFIANDRRAARAIKRGGGRAIVPLNIDAADGESRYRLEPAHEQTPERAFDRQWAMTLLARVMDRLTAECSAAGPDKAAQFAKLRPCLTREGEPLAQIAAELGTTEAAIKMALSRLRARYKAMLREEVAQTVDAADDPAAVDAEIRYLMAALAG